MQVILILDWRSPKSVWYLDLLDEGFQALARGGRNPETLALPNGCRKQFVFNGL
jgi:hypothetical protein